MKLSGATLIRNGEILGYPWKICVQNMLKVCDEVILNVGDSEDATRHEAEKIKQKNDKLVIIDSVWNMKNTGDGSELANQANIATAQATGDWILYMQADELVHEQEHAPLREFLTKQQDGISQVELLRTYFWKTLKQRAPQHELFLGRVFRKGTHVVGGDGMYLVRSAGEVVRSPFLIYHYSRIGSEKSVTARVRTLDKLFHSEDEVSKMPPFTFEEVSQLVPYSGTHPDGITDLYGVSE